LCLSRGRGPLSHRFMRGEESRCEMCGKSLTATAAVVAAVPLKQCQPSCHWSCPGGRQLSGPTRQLEAGHKDTGLRMSRPQRLFGGFRRFLLLRREARGGEVRIPLLSWDLLREDGRGRVRDLNKPQFITHQHTCYIVLGEYPGNVILYSRRPGYHSSLISMNVK
jgi:hypothetical protein